MLFNDLHSLVRVVAAGAAGYCALILFLRISGKRSLSQLNAFDYIVTVALGSALSSILLSSSVALADGLLALILLLAMQFLLTSLSVRVPWIKAAVRSRPTLLVRNGKLLEAALRRERVTPDEVLAAIRKHGIGCVEEVAAVVLETDGSMSVIGNSRSVEELTALKGVRGSGATGVTKQAPAQARSPAER